MCLRARNKYHLPSLQDLLKKKKTDREKPQATATDSSSESKVGLRTWSEEFPALEVVRLAPALVAVGVATREAVHQVVVLRAGAIPTIAVLRKVAGVHGSSAWGSRNSELRRRRTRGIIVPS